MKFIVLLQHLENRLGYHQVPVNVHANRLQDLFECSPLHHDMMLRLSQAIYKKNGCTSIIARIDRDQTLAALGEIRLEVLRSTDTDVDLFEYIEELCFAVEAAFTENDRRRIQRESLAEQQSRMISKGADVIDLANYRQRRSNSSA